MHTSRYYLPPQPGARLAPSAGGPPTFTSQTLLQSLKGFDKTRSSQSVAVVRVRWTAFTPRFMCEYMRADGRFQRKERLFFYDGMSQTQQQPLIPFKGPFDYVMYNGDKYNDDKNKDHPNAENRNYSVNRPPPSAYQAGLAQAGRGVEVELLSDQGGSSTPKVLDGKTFTDAEGLNSLGTPARPVWVLSSQLRYRVRFRYPVDPLVDPGGGTTDADKKPWVDPAKQYLLDTPVFEGISVTYMIPPRIMDFHEVTE
jgi:hypothetical protein